MTSIIYTYSALYALNVESTVMSSTKQMVSQELIRVCLFVHFNVADVFSHQLNDDKLSDVTPIGQGWTNARGLRGLGGPKHVALCPFLCIYSN